MVSIVPGLDLRGMRIGFKTSQTNVDWPTLKATWELGDSLPVFDSGWIFDHFVALGGAHAAMLEVAAGLAQAGAQHLILIVPAGDGPDGLQLLADRVAVPLRERFA